MRRIRDEIDARVQKLRRRAARPATADARSRSRARRRRRSATFALVFAGCGAIMVNAEDGGALGQVGIAITFGLVIMA